MGKILEAQEELFGEEVTSTEPENGPIKSARGKKAVLIKGKEFAAMIQERHSGSFSDPIIAGKYFSCAMTLDATFREMGRMKLEEICLWEVKDGKIVTEQFFY